RCRRRSPRPGRERAARTPERAAAVLTGSANALTLVLALVAAAAAGAGVTWWALRRSSNRRREPVPGAIEDAEFGSLVSHDLRAPIRVVEGFTRIVKEDYGPVLGRLGVDHLDRVLGAAGRMNAMIDALLALARLSSQPLARSPVDLSLLAGHVVDDLRRLDP